MRKVVRRGNFTSVADLEGKLQCFLAYDNQTMAHPFEWTDTGKPLHKPRRIEYCPPIGGPANTPPSNWRNGPSDGPINQNCRTRKGQSKPHKSQKQKGAGSTPTSYQTCQAIPASGVLTVWPDQQQRRVVRPCSTTTRQLGDLSNMSKKRFPKDLMLMLLVRYEQDIHFQFLAMPPRPDLRGQDRSRRNAFRLGFPAE